MGEGHFGSQLDKPVEKLKYLQFVVHINEDVDSDVTHNIREEGGKADASQCNSS